MLSHIHSQSHHPAVNLTTALNLPGSTAPSSLPTAQYSLLYLFLHLTLIPPLPLSPQCLQSLSLNESRLRSRGTVLVNALGSNTCLRKVDLSGNNMDDIGAKMLSKALQINTTLRWGVMNVERGNVFVSARRFVFSATHDFALQECDMGSQQHLRSRISRLGPGAWTVRALKHLQHVVCETYAVI